MTWVPPSAEAAAGSASAAQTATSAESEVRKVMRLTSAAPSAPPTTRSPRWTRVVRTLRPRVPEGDTIHYAANRIRPLLQGRVPDEIDTPHPRFRLDRWPERLAGRTVSSVDAHGKHLFLRFEGDLTVHSHLRMTGSWRGLPRGARASRSVWLGVRRGGMGGVQLNGPGLARMTGARARLDQAPAGPRGRHPPPPV